MKTMQRVLMAIHSVLTVTLALATACHGADEPGRLLGVAVAADKAPRLTALPATKRDMQNLSRVLCERGAFYVSSVVTLQSEPSDMRYVSTKANIASHLSAISDLALPSDVLIFSFHGHAMMSGGQDFLCPHDSADSLDSQLAVSEIFTIASRSRAKLKLIVLSGCRHDPSNRVGTPLAASEGNQFDQGQTDTAFVERIPRSTIVISSADAGQVSYSGVFGSYLMEGLAGAADTNGDTAVTVLEAFRYAAANTSARVEKMLQQTQTPTLRGEFRADCLDYVLTHVRQEQLLGDQAAVEKHDPSWRDRDQKTAQKLFRLSSGW